MVLALFTTSVIQAQNPPKKKPNFKIYHVQADRGEKPSIPKDLKKYEKQLKVIGNQFKLLSKSKGIYLEPNKPAKLPLPNKLGQAQVLLNADKSVSLVLISVKDPKKPYATKHRRFPIFAATPKDKFKLPKGQYLLIVEKIEDKK